MLWCSWCHPLPLMPKGERDSDGSMLLGGARVVVINDKGGDCCYSLSLMPTSLMIVLMTTTVMWNLFDVVEPIWWRWSLVDDDKAWRCSNIALCLHALMMPYVFIVFIDACGWIPCHMMPWSHGSRSWWRCDDCLMMSFGHDGDDMHWWWHDTFTWWRWHTLMWCLMSLLEPWWVSAMPCLLMRIPYPFLNPSSPLHYPLTLPIS